MLIKNICEKLNTEHLKTLRSSVVKYSAGFVFFLIGISSLSLEAQSNTQGIQVLADSMERDSVKGQIFLIGNVHVTFKDQILNADKATIYLNEKRVIAEGNVILQSLKVHAEGSRIEFNYDTNTGVFYDGYIKSGQVVFQGRLVEKLGEYEYVATEGTYTACETCPPAWSFSGKSIHAELGGYARISRPIMRVGGVPILILPGLIVPLKSQRQTGFLTPRLTFSERGGTAIGEDFFWAISRSQDLTLSLDRFDKLGYKTGAEYRYALSESSDGSLAGSHIRDRQIKNEDQNDNITQDFDRWFLKYRHLYKLPENYTHRLSINAASDLRYPRDFPMDLPYNGDPALENSMSLTKNSKNQHFSAQAILYTNLLKADPRESNEDSVHRFPQLQYSIKETRVFDTDLLFKSDINYVQFSRAGLSYDDITTNCGVNPSGGASEFCTSPSRDGSFNVDLTPTGGRDFTQRDFIRTGQRLDIMPTLSYPILIAQSLNLTPSVTYRETQYNFDLAAPVNQVVPVGEQPENYSNFAAQRYVQTDLAARTRFGRVYNFESDDETTSRKIKHEIEPEISYSKIPWIRRPDHGFFGDFEGQPYSQTLEPISDEDVIGANRLQFDYNDRIFDKDLVTFQLTNRLTRKRWLAGRSEYKEVAMFRVSQSYDLNEAEDDTPQPWSTVNALLDVKLDHFETYTQSIYYPYAKVNNLSTRVKILNDARDYIELSYLRSVRVTEDNVARRDSQTDVMGFGLGFETKYIDLNGALTYSNTENQFQGWRSDLLIKPPGNCWGILISANQPTNGTFSYKFNASFNYGGETETPRP